MTNQWTTPPLKIDQAIHCTGRMSNVSLIASFPGPFWPGNKTIETTPLHRVWWYLCMMLTIQKYNQNTEFHFCRGMLLLLSDHFSKDAADAPDINWSGVVLGAQQQLWWSVPQCDDLERKREEKGERGGKGKGRKGEERISEKGGRQSYGYYLRAPYVSLGDSDCAATCTIWGWCLFEELRYWLPWANLVCVSPDWNYECPSQSKVSQFYHTTSIDEQVLRLQVSVKNSMGVAEWYPI